MNQRPILTLFATMLLFSLFSANSLAEIRFAVFSDPHYYDSDLGTTGAAFEAYLAQDRKLIRESGAIVKAVVEQIFDANAVEPLDYVIVPGDLTKDGEMDSHLEFANYLGRLEGAGIPVFVAPGNHDINNPHAVAYDGDTTVPVDNVSPEAFSSIYGPFGYDEALAHDPDSLSYAAEPAPGVVFLALDSCKYDENLTAAIRRPAARSNTPPWSGR